MDGYSEFIENALFIEEVDSCITTGDPEYPGTALEVATKGGQELLHVVVNRKGQIQVLFLAQPTNYRLPLELLERILSVARDRVTYTP